MNILGTLLYVVVYLLLVLGIWKVGFFPIIRWILNAATAFATRFLEGPKRVKPDIPGESSQNTPPGSLSASEKDCRLMHETARLEIELYGQIVSDSVAQYLNECSISPSKITHEPPNLAENCLHEYTFGEREINGAGYIACEFCGHTKRLSNSEYASWLSP